MVELCRRESEDLTLAKILVKEKQFFDSTFTDVHMSRQKVPKSEFQSHFSMSKII